MAEKKEAEKKTQKAQKPTKDEVKKEDVKDQKEQTENVEPDEEESYLKDLMAISGYGGLFKFISQGRNGIIVEHLDTKKRMQAFATMKVSALEDIAVYTEDEEIKLSEVFLAIHKYENGKETISPKSDPDELKDYFGAVLPDYDRERVYVSDIKKILGWYNMLLGHKMIETGKPDEKKPAEKKPAEKKVDKPADKTAEKPSDKSADKSAD
jgi:hypothetical protein